MTSPSTQLPEKVYLAFVAELKSLAIFGFDKPKPDELHACLFKQTQSAATQFFLCIVLWVFACGGLWFLGGYANPPGRPPFGLMYTGFGILTTVQVLFLYYRRMASYEFLLRQYNITAAMYSALKDELPSEPASVEMELVN